MKFKRRANIFILLLHRLARMGGCQRSFRDILVPVDNRNNLDSGRTRKIHETATHRIGTLFSFSNRSIIHPRVVDKSIIQYSDCETNLSIHVSSSMTDRNTKNIQDAIEVHRCFAIVPSVSGESSAWKQTLVKRSKRKINEENQESSAPTNGTWYK